MNVIPESRQIRWIAVNGPAGVAAGARAGRSKSAWLFTARWFVETGAVIGQLGSHRLIQLGSVNFWSGEIALRRVEELVESSMVLVLHDWELYQAAKGKR